MNVTSFGVKKAVRTFVLDCCVGTCTGMADIVFVAIALAFFALCVLYVKWCDRIIGRDEAGR